MKENIMRKYLSAIGTALFAGALMGQAQQPSTPPASLDLNAGTTPQTQSSNPAPSMLTPNSPPAAQQGTVDAWGNRPCPNCTNCCEQACKLHGWLDVDYLL